MVLYEIQVARNLKCEIKQFCINLIQCDLKFVLMQKYNLCIGGLCLLFNAELSSCYIKLLSRGLYVY